MTRSFTSAFASVMSAKLLLVIFGAITAPALTRLLGASSYGVYATVIAVFSITEILITSGVNSGAKKYLSESREFPGWKSQVFAYYFRLGLLLAVIGASIFVLVAASGLIDGVLGPEYRTYFYLIGAYLIALQAREYVLRSLMGLQLERLSEPIRVCYEGLFAALAIGLAWLGYGVAGVLWAHVIASLVGSAIGLYYVEKRLELGAVVRSATQDFPRRELLTFNNESIVFIFLLTSLYHIDVLMATVFVPESQIGFYKAALVLVGFLWLVPQSVQDVLIQSVSDHWRRNDLDEINRIASRTTRYILLFSTLLGIGLAALADPFVPLYFGAEFEPTILPLLVLIPGTIGFAAARPMLVITQAKGEVRPLIIATGIVAVGNVVLNALLIPRFGILGAAVATTIGYSMLPVAQTAIAREMGYDPFRDVGFLQFALVCVLGSLAIGGLAAIVPGLLALVVVPPLGAVLFVGICVLTGAIRRSEVERGLALLRPNRSLPARSEND